MSLKDLLPPGTYEEITSEAKLKPEDLKATEHSQRGILVQCPTCHKVVTFDKSNPFRPFCSERCKLIDLGEWADEEHTVPGNPIDQDEDADLLNDPNLPVRNIPQDK